MDRNSVVRNIEIISLVSSSVLQVGDTKILTPMSRAIAIQRQDTNYDPDEHELDLYPMFSYPLPPLAYECIPVKTVQENLSINVNSIRIIGVAASSVVHIGKTDYVSSEARVKHIRQFAVSPYE